MPSGGLAGTVGQKTENRKRTKLDLESGSPTKNISNFVFKRIFQIVLTTLKTIVMHTPK